MKISKCIMKQQHCCCWLPLMRENMFICTEIHTPHHASGSRSLPNEKQLWLRLLLFWILLNDKTLSRTFAENTTPHQMRYGQTFPFYGIAFAGVFGTWRCFVLMRRRYVWAEAHVAKSFFLFENFQSSHFSLCDGFRYLCADDVVDNCWTDDARIIYFTCVHERER